MKIYLDNCCFNRPFDNQSSLIIYLETEAKLYVQELIRKGEIELVWSFMLDYENDANPYKEKRNQIAEWKEHAVVDCSLTDKVSVSAGEFIQLGLRPKDAAHIACSIHSGAEYFLTTDNKILNKPISGVEVMNPVDFVRRYLDEK